MHFGYVSTKRDAAVLQTHDYFLAIPQWRHRNASGDTLHVPVGKQKLSGSERPLCTAGLGYNRVVIGGCLVLQVMHRKRHCLEAAGCISGRQSRQRRLGKV